MRSTLRMLALTASFAALFVIGGGHWAALQTAAWARMIVSYTHDTGSLRLGMTQAFDGAHPCKYCRQISAGIEKERQDDRQQTGQNEQLGKTSLLTVLPTIFFASLVRRGESLRPPTDRLASLWADAPPVPPPRAV